jgi:hypothetical protein
MQPFMKLVQANMALLSKAVPAGTTAAPSTPGAFPGLPSPAVFTEITQGLTKNYSEFLTEVSQNSMALLTQAQSTFMPK